MPIFDRLGRGLRRLVQEDLDQRDAYIQNHRLLSPEETLEGELPNITYIHMLDVDVDIDPLPAPHSPLIIGPTTDAPIIKPFDRVYVPDATIKDTSGQAVDVPEFSYHVKRATSSAKKISFPAGEKGHKNYPTHDSKTASWRFPASKSVHPEDFAYKRRFRHSEQIGAPGEAVPARFRGLEKCADSQDFVHEKLIAMDQARRDIDKEIESIEKKQGKMHPLQKNSRFAAAEKIKKLEKEQAVNLEMSDINFEYLKYKQKIKTDTETEQFIDKMSHDKIASAEKRPVATYKAIDLNPNESIDAAYEESRTARIKSRRSYNAYKKSIEEENNIYNTVSLNADHNMEEKAGMAKDDVKRTRSLYIRTQVEEGIADQKLMRLLDLHSLQEVELFIHQREPFRAQIRALDTEKKALSEDDQLFLERLDLTAMPANLLNSGIGLDPTPYIQQKEGAALEAAYNVDTVEGLQKNYIAIRNLRLHRSKLKESLRTVYGDIRKLETSIRKKQSTLVDETVEVGTPSNTAKLHDKKIERDKFEHQLEVLKKQEEIFEKETMTQLNSSSRSLFRNFMEGMSFMEETVHERLLTHEQSVREEYEKTTEKELKIAEQRSNDVRDRASAIIESERIEHHAKDFLKLIPDEKQEGQKIVVLTATDKMDIARDMAKNFNQYNHVQKERVQLENHVHELKEQLAVVEQLIPDETLSSQELSEDELKIQNENGEHLVDLHERLKKVTDRLENSKDVEADLKSKMARHAKLDSSEAFEDFDNQIYVLQEAAVIDSARLELSIGRRAIARSYIPYHQAPGFDRELEAEKLENLYYEYQSVMKKRQDAIVAYQEKRLHIDNTTPKDKVNEYDLKNKNLNRQMKEDVARYEEQQDALKASIMERIDVPSPFNVNQFLDKMQTQAATYNAVAEESVVPRLEALSAYGLATSHNDTIFEQTPSQAEAEAEAEAHNPGDELTLSEISRIEDEEKLIVADIKAKTPGAVKRALTSLKNKFSASRKAQAEEQELSAEEALIQGIDKDAWQKGLLFEANPEITLDYKEFRDMYRLAAPGYDDFLWVNEDLVNPTGGGGYSSFPSYRKQKGDGWNTLPDHDATFDIPGLNLKDSFDEKNGRYFRQVNEMGEHNIDWKSDELKFLDRDTAPHVEPTIYGPVFHDADKTYDYFMHLKNPDQYKDFLDENVLVHADRYPDPEFSKIPKKVKVPASITDQLPEFYDQRDFLKGDPRYVTASNHKPDLVPGEDFSFDTWQNSEKRRDASKKEQPEDDAASGEVIFKRTKATPRDDYLQAYKDVTEHYDNMRYTDQVLSDMNAKLQFYGEVQIPFDLISSRQFVKSRDSDLARVDYLYNSEKLKLDHELKLQINDLHIEAQKDIADAYMAHQQKTQDLNYESANVLSASRAAKQKKELDQFIKDLDGFAHTYGDAERKQKWLNEQREDHIKLSNELSRVDNKLTYYHDNVLTPAIRSVDIDYDAELAKINHNLDAMIDNAKTHHMSSTTLLSEKRKSELALRKMSVEGEAVKSKQFIASIQKQEQALKAQMEVVAKEKVKQAGDLAKLLAKRTAAQLKAERTSDTDLRPLRQGNTEEAAMSDAQKILRIVHGGI